MRPVSVSLGPHSEAIFFRLHCVSHQLATPDQSSTFAFAVGVSCCCFPLTITSLATAVVQVPSLRVETRSVTGARPMTTLRADTTTKSGVRSRTGTLPGGHSDLPVGHSCLPVCDKSFSVGKSSLTNLHRGERCGNPGDVIEQDFQPGQQLKEVRSLRLARRGNHQGRRLCRRHGLLATGDGLLERATAIIYLEPKPLWSDSGVGGSASVRRLGFIKLT